MLRCEVVPTSIGTVLLMLLAGQKRKTDALSQVFHSVIGGVCGVGGGGSGGEYMLVTGFLTSCQPHMVTLG